MIPLYIACLSVIAGLAYGGTCEIADHVTWGDWCYYAPPTGTFSWDEAEEYCQDAGMELASIHSMDENDFLHDYVGQVRGVGSYWFGLVRDDNSFRWTDGTSFDFENWAGGEPSSEAEKCANIKEDGTWNDLSCDGYELGIICKGYNSAVQYIQCAHGWFESPESGTCLQFFLEKKKWSNARDSCIDEGGDLVKIINEEMNNFITEKIIEAGTKNLWIGLHDDRSEGVFVWLNETEEASWTNWDDNQPDNWQGGQDCVEIGVDGDNLSLWGDSECSKSTYSICEAAPAVLVTTQDCAQALEDCAALYDASVVLPALRCVSAEAWSECVQALPSLIGCTDTSDALAASAEAVTVCYNTDEGAACAALQDVCRNRFEKRVDSDPNLSCSYAAAWINCLITPEVMFECGPKPPEDVAQIRDEECYAFLLDL